MTTPELPTTTRFATSKTLQSVIDQSKPGDLIVVRGPEVGRKTLVGIGATVHLRPGITIVGEAGLSAAEIHSLAQGN